MNGVLVRIFDTITQKSSAWKGTGGAGLVKDVTNAKYIDELGAEYTVVRAFADPVTLGSNAIVAAQGAGKTIRVLAVTVVAAAANSIRFLSAATSISALFALAANGGLVLARNRDGWIETAANEALNLNLSAGTAVGVQLTYVVRG